MNAPNPVSTSADEDEHENDTGLDGVAHRRVVLPEADRTRQRRARRSQEHDRQEQGAHGYICRVLRWKAAP